MLISTPGQGPRAQLELVFQSEPITAILVNPCLLINDRGKPRLAKSWIIVGCNSLFFLMEHVLKHVREKITERIRTIKFRLRDTVMFDLGCCVIMQICGLSSRLAILALF